MNSSEVNGPSEISSSGNRSGHGLDGSSAPSTQPATRNLDPATIPDHELLKKIGEGSYGEVWLARSAVGTMRAVKIVWRKTFWHDHPFEREFKGIQKFEPISRSHDGLVDILQIGRGEGYFYYVMELADDAERKSNDEIRNPKEVRNPNDQTGTPLAALRISNLGFPSTFEIRHLSFYTPRTLTSELQRRPRLPVSECLQIGLSLTSALGHLHQNGLVHRDVKPGNIIFVGGVPKLADIGLVAEMAEARSYVGTEGFIPPEGPGSPQADIYSLGKLLYEISTGKDRHAFPELPSNLAELSEAHRLVELNAVVVKACQNDVGERYKSAEDMHADLLLLKTGQSVKRQRSVQQRWAVGKKASLAVVLLGLVTAATLFLLRSLPDRDLRSANEEVNKLVEQGNLSVLSGTPERQRHALGCFKRALEIEPKFMPAYFGLFRVYVGQRDENRSADFDSEVRRTAAKLLETAPSLAEAQIAISYTKWLARRWPDALADAQKATQMRAGTKEARATVHDIYGCFLISSGHPEAASQQYQLAERESRTDPTIQQHLGFPFFLRGDFNRAQKHFHMATDLEPRFDGGHYWEGRVYEEKGEFEKAIEEFEEYDQLTEQHKGKLFYDELRRAVRQSGGEGYWRKRLEIALSASPPEVYGVATSLARLGRKDEAYARLEEAEKKGGFDIGNLVFDLCWDHNDERFKAIAKKVGLMQ